MASAATKAARTTASKLLKRMWVLTTKVADHPGLRENGPRFLLPTALMLFASPRYAELSGTPVAERMDQFIDKHRNKEVKAERKALAEAEKKWTVDNFVNFWRAEELGNKYDPKTKYQAKFGVMYNKDQLESQGSGSAASSLKSSDAASDI